MTISNENKKIEDYKMATDVETIIGDLTQPTIWKVGAEIKREYNVIQQLLKFTSPRNEIVDIANVSDEEFAKMGERAIKERKLFFRLTDGTERAFEFSEISARFNSIDEEKRRELGARNIHLDSMIPTEQTIRTVAETTHAAIEEKKGFDFGIFFAAVWNLLGSVIDTFKNKDEKIEWGKLWDKASAEAAAPKVKEHVETKLTELANSDRAASLFLDKNLDTARTVKHEIGNRVPAGVYEHFKQDIPEKFQTSAPANSILNTIPKDKIEINVSEVIEQVRIGVLKPERDGGKKGDLIDETAQKIFNGSQEMLADAEKKHEEASFIDKSKTYPRLQIVNDLALKSKDEATALATNISTIVADSFVSALKHDTKLMSKAELTDHIVKTVAANLDKEQNNLQIRKIAHDWTGYADKGAKLFNLEVAKELPPRSDNKDANEYIVVSLYTKDKNGATIRDTILNTVRTNITDEVYQNLNIAANAIQSENPEPKKTNAVISPAHTQADAIKTSLGATYPYADTEKFNSPTSLAYAKTGNNIEHG